MQPISVHLHDKLLNSTILIPVIFLKKRLNVAWSSKPNMYDISFALLLLYRSIRLASASTRSWITRKGDGNLQIENILDNVFGDLFNSSA